MKIMKSFTLEGTSMEISSMQSSNDLLLIKALVRSGVHQYVLSYGMSLLFEGMVAICLNSNDGIHL